MANKVKPMLQIRRILQLIDQGVSLRGISRELSMSFNTVKKYQQIVEKNEHSNQQLLLLDDSSLSLLFYPHEGQSRDLKREQIEGLIPDYIERLHKTHITRELLWQEYRKLYPDGYKYSRFCEYITRKIELSNAVMHFDHKPGECLQIDFAGDKLSYVNRDSGEIIECPVLVCTLPFSNLTYVEALPNQTQTQLIGALNRCLAFLGGVPRSIKSDNLKQVVTKANRYEPIISEIIDQFALHYTVSITAARIVKPRDKASVERHVGIAYQRIYALVEQQQCYSLKDLNAKIMTHLNTLNNTPMQRKEHSRNELFLQMEKPLLGLLPLEPFEIKHQAMAKVARNYHVILGEDWHLYSVPFQYIGKQVMLVYNDSTVEIYYQNNRIALHGRNYQRHGYSTQENHMPAKHQAVTQMRGYTPEYFLSQAQRIGPNTKQVIQKIIDAKFFTEQTFNTCLGIIRLQTKYTAERLEKACQMVLPTCHITYRTINTILQNNRDKVIESQTKNITANKQHNNIRGKENYRTLFDDIYNQN
jgi:transposase